MLKPLTHEECMIEDRRAPHSQGRPSIVMHGRCPDCGEKFLVIIAVSDTSNLSERCTPCYKAKPVLLAGGKGDGSSGLFERKIMGPEELPGVLTHLAERGYKFAWLRFENGVKMADYDLSVDPSGKGMFENKVKTRK